MRAALASPASHPPDDITYMPVSPESFMFKAGAAWQFPAFAICLGSSYLQRLMVRLPQVAEAALACPGFEDYCSYLPGEVRWFPASAACMGLFNRLGRLLGGWCTFPAYVLQKKSNTVPNNVKFASNHVTLTYYNSE